jgi:hypothetical protein
MLRRCHGAVAECAQPEVPVAVEHGDAAAAGKAVGERKRKKGARRAAAHDHDNEARHLCGDARAEFALGSRAGSIDPALVGRRKNGHRRYPRLGLA